MSLKELLRLFEKNKQFLKDADWIVCDVESPKWWGGLNSPEEIVISAILVQLSTWTSVEKVLMKLRKAGLTNFRELAKADAEKLEELIKPVGLGKMKARRLISFAREVMKLGGLERLKDVEDSRNFLMSFEGIGKETADAIALFALNKPTIPISNYVRLVLGRVGLIESKKNYETLRKEILEKLGEDLFSLKLLYAGITSIGRMVCKRDPRCEACPLREACMTSKCKRKSKNPTK